jgi:hypothetical protein
MHALPMCDGQPVALRIEDEAFSITSHTGEVTGPYVSTSVGDRSNVLTFRVFRSRETSIVVCTLRCARSAKRLLLEVLIQRAAPK